MIYSLPLLNWRHACVVGSLSDAEKSDSLLVFDAKCQFDDLQIEAIPSWATGFEQSLYRTRREEDVCVLAAEEQGAGSCRAWMGAEELGPELAGAGSEECNGVTEQGNRIGDWWRIVCLCGLIGGGGLNGEAIAISVGGIEAYGNQDEEY